jgi:uncharacterized protein (TIGR02231 family)
VLDHSSRQRPLLCLAALLLVLPASPLVAGLSADPVAGQTAAPVATPVAVDPKPLAATATITAVTLYQGRAAVTRSATPSVAPGIWEVRFDDLPALVDRDSLQATVAAPAKLLDVRYEESQSAEDLSKNPDGIALRKEIETIERSIALATARVETIASSIKVLDSIATRLSEAASKGLGTDALDPAKLAAQIAALAEQRDTLAKESIGVQAEVKSMHERRAAAAARLAQLGGEVRTSRSGVITLAMAADTPTPVALQLTYLVGGATWVPSYGIRAASDLSGLQVEYDAVIRQRTGERWENVALTLSTAQPARAAQPVELVPLYVDLSYDGFAERDGVVPSKAPPPPPTAKPMYSLADGAGSDTNGGMSGAMLDAELAAREATVVQNATAATFTLPRTVTLVSDAQRDQKTRIDSISLKPTYTYVTRPAVDAAAYLRGTVRNESQYQLLAGQARVFLGGDSVGVTTIEDIAPGGEFELWFGADKRIDVERKLIARNTSTSGLLSKSDDIEWQYRVTLKNMIAAPTSIEVWDRMPVSRNEEITVTLREVSPALATDKKYETNERKQGLLKWSLTLPAKTEEKGPSSMTVSWTVRLSKPEKSPITPLPE